MPMRSFGEIIISRKCASSLSFTDVGESCICRKFFTWQICLLTVFAKISEFTVCSEMLCG